jgi:hypothetical protein
VFFRDHERPKRLRRRFSSGRVLSSLPARETFTNQVSRDALALQDLPSDDARWLRRRTAHQALADEAG